MPKARQTFQLVLQLKPWGNRGLKDFDNLVALEKELQLALGDSAQVDGHDMGSDEANVFIHCSDPLAAFTDCLAPVGSKGLLGQLSAAYRSFDGAAYTRVWPKDTKAEFSVT